MRESRINLCPIILLRFWHDIDEFSSILSSPFSSPSLSIFWTSSSVNFLWKVRKQFFRSFSVMKPSWKFQNMRWKVRLTKYFVLIQHLECFLHYKLVFRSHFFCYIWNWTIQLLKAGTATVICFKKYKYSWLIREGWQQIFSFTNPYAHIK